jgi:hypothetical protein
MGSQESSLFKNYHENNSGTTIDLPKTASEIRTWWKNVRANVSSLPLSELYQVLKSTAALVPISQLKDSIELAESLVTLVNTVPLQK